MYLYAYMCVYVYIYIYISFKETVAFKNCCLITYQYVSYYAEVLEEVKMADWMFHRNSRRVLMVQEKESQTTGLYVNPTSGSAIYY